MKLSEAVRDALAMRRKTRRQGSWPTRPGGYLQLARKRYDFAPDGWPAAFGLAAYLPDPPIPLPGGES